MNYRQMGLALLALASGPAWGQSTASIDKALDRAEARADRGEAATATSQAILGLDGGVAPVKNWTLSFALPLSFNSNVANAETGRLSAVHTAPAVELKGVWDISPSATFSLTAKAEMDVFSAHTDNDTSGLSGIAEFAIGNPDERLSPYIRYTANSLYAGQWEGHLITTHLFGLGVRRNFKLSVDDSVALNVSYNRREASVITAEQHRFAGQLGYNGKIDGKTGWSLAARVQYSDYTGGASAARNDVQLRTIVGVTHKLTPGLTVSADMMFLRNWSNFAGKDYSVIDAGPSIKLTKKF